LLGKACTARKETIAIALMIFDTLKFIQMALQDYILEVEQAAESQSIAVLDNIALADELGGTRDNLNGHIVITLVNLQEETTLKNSPHYRQENGRTVYRNPPISLNLFILFAALHGDQYETSLKRLSRVVEFFQWRKELSFATLSPERGGISLDISVFMDLYSLTFEQVNHLWGTLGGKQVPFVLYRARLVTVEAEKRQAEGEQITEILISS
jgi:hypothetical protein